MSNQEITIQLTPTVAERLDGFASGSTAPDKTTIINWFLGAFVAIMDAAVGTAPKDLTTLHIKLLSGDILVVHVQAIRAADGNYLVDQLAATLRTGPVARIKAFRQSCRAWVSRH